MDIATLGVNIKYDSVKQAGVALDKFSQSGEKAEKATKNLTSATDTLKQVLSGLALGAVAMQAIKVADAYTQMQSKLRLVTQSTQELLAVQSQLNKVAVATFSEQGAVTELYAKMQPSLAALGKTTQDTVKFVETFNKALALTNPNAQQAQAAVMQFAQAMGAGALRGDEFASLMENANGVMQKLAVGLGVPIGALRGLASEGKLTADVVYAALNNATESINSDFDKMALTVSNASQTIETGMFNLVGSINNATGATSSLAEVMHDFGQVLNLAANYVDIYAQASAEAEAKTKGMSGILDTASQSATNLHDVFRQVASVAYDVGTGIDMIVLGLGGLVATMASVGDSKQMQIVLQDTRKELDMIIKRNSDFKESLNIKSQTAQTVEGLKSIDDELKAIFGSSYEAEKATIKFTGSTKEAEKASKVHAKTLKEQAKAHIETIEALDKQVEAISKAEQSFRKYLNGSDFTSQADELNEVTKAWKVLADNGLATTDDLQKAIDAVTMDRFGDTEKSIDKLENKYDSFYSRFSKINDPIIDSFGAMMDATAEYFNNYEKLREGIARGDQKAISVNERNQLAMYGNIAGAMSTMFKEGSKEQKAMFEIQKAITIATLALDMQKMASTMGLIAAKTTEATVAGTAAVLTQGSGDPYSAWVRMAAMAATVGTLLGAIGGSSPSVSSASIPAALGGNGIDSPLGSTDPSQSVGNSLEYMQDIEANQYKELRKIYDEMQDLNANITGFATALYTTGDIRSIGTNVSGVGSKSPYDFLQKDIANPLKDIPIIGQAAEWGLNLIGNTLSSVFGGSSKTSVTGTGLYLGDFALGANADLQSYADIKKETDGGWFGSSKTSYSTQFNDITGQSEQAFQKIFDNLQEGMKEIGTQLGYNIDAQVDAFKVSIGKIATDGKTGAEIEQALQEAISTQTDKLAYAMFPDLVNKYAQLNEGYFETLTRLVVDKAVVESTLGDVGMSIDGDVIAISQSLVKLSGSLSDFVSNTNDFIDAFYTDAQKAELTAQTVSSIFESIGMSAPASREALVQLVQALDLTTEAGQKAYIAITGATSVLDQYYKVAETKVENIATTYENTNQAIIDSEKRLSDARIAALKEQRSITETELRRLQSIGALVKSTLDAVMPKFAPKGGLSYATSELGRFVASGIVPAQEEVASVLDIVKAQDKTFYSTYEEYALDQARANSAANEFLSMVNSNTAAQELTLNAIDATIVAETDKLNATLLALGDKVVGAVAMVSAKTSTGASAVSGGSSGSSKWLTGDTVTGYVEGYGITDILVGTGYKDMLADTASLYGMSAQAFDQWINPNSYQYRDWTGYATGGYTGNMATDAIAGVVHGQEYVVNAKTTRDLGLNNQGGVFVQMANELTLLRQEVADLKAQDRQIGVQLIKQTRTTADTLDKWDSVGMPA